MDYRDAETGTADVADKLDLLPVEFQREISAAGCR